MSACSRKGCEEVMCDRLSNHYGYICGDCFDELSAKGINTDIREFLDSHKAFKTVSPKDYFALVFLSYDERH